MPFADFKLGRKRGRERQGEEMVGVKSKRVREGKGTACKDAIVFFVCLFVFSLALPKNVKILIGQI